MTRYAVLHALGLEPFDTGEALSMVPTLCLWRDVELVEAWCNMCEVRHGLNESETRIAPHDGKHRNDLDS